MTTNEKIALLRSAMAEQQVSAYYFACSDPHASEYLPDHFRTLTWFSGFNGESCTFVVTKTASALWCDGRYFVQAERELAGSEVQMMRMGEPETPKPCCWAADALQPGETLALDGATTGVKLVNEIRAVLEEKGCTLLNADLAGKIWDKYDRPALPNSPAWLLTEEYAGASIAQKLAAVRASLKEKKATAGIFCSLGSVAWLMNLRAMDINCTPYALAYAFVTEEDCTLAVDTSRMSTVCRRDLEGAGVSLIHYDQIVDFLGEWRSTPETVLYDPDSTNYAVYQALADRDIYTLVAAADPILLLKAVKNEGEIRNTKIAHIHDAVAMCRFQMELEQWMAGTDTLTETDVDTILHKHRSARAEFIVESFNTIAAYGPNAAMMHYHATKDNQSEILRRGFLLVDSGATYYDGTTDITRTYAVGELTEDEKKFYTWTLQSHIDMAKAIWLDYCTGGELDAIAREPLWRHLINYRCGTGHGVSHVGNVHEGPVGLRPHNACTFVPGMVVTDEPGVYETDLVGIRIENELLVTECCKNQYGRFLQFEPLTYVPIDTTPLLLEELDKDELAWLNRYHAACYEKLSPLMTEAEQHWLAEKCRPLVKE